MQACWTRFKRGCNDCYTFKPGPGHWWSMAHNMDSAHDLQRQRTMTKLTMSSLRVSNTFRVSEHVSELFPSRLEPDPESNPAARTESHLNGVIDFGAACLLALATWAIVQILIFFEGVFVPFLVALFIMYLVDPVVRLLVRPRDLSDCPCDAAKSLKSNSNVRVNLSKKTSNISHDTEHVDLENGGKIGARRASL